MDDLAKHFPASATYTYLNTAAIGLIPKAVYDFRTNEHKTLLEKGSLLMEKNANLQAEVREKIGSFFNADPGFVALLPAFSFGFNAILEGLKSGAHIILLDNDYPSINLAVEARDFSITNIDIDAHLEERIYDAFKNEQPDVFIFSQVQYLNGVKINPEFIKTLKKDFPDTLLIADGTQYLGTEQFDFRTSGLDVLGASAYKWLGSGFGNGFFMFQPEVEQKIEPKYLGFGSTMGKYKDAGSTFIGKFEGNHLDSSNIGSIKIGLEFHEKMGKKAIEQKVASLAEKAKTALSDLNLLEDYVVERKQHSSIFNIKGDDALFDKLIKNNVICAQRGTGIRIGFHYYNDEKDLDKLLRIVQ